MKRSRQRGQALVEFALILPLLFLLIVNVVNFGGYFYAWITVTHATRSAVESAVQSGAYLGYGSAHGVSASATPTALTNMLTSCSGTTKGDMCSLPNVANASVSVCSNNATSGTAKAESPETCISPVTDPQSTTSAVATVQVTYRYCPYIPSWDFPSLGIHSTLPSCGTGGTSGGVVIQRTAAMRIIQ